MHKALFYICFSCFCLIFDSSILLITTQQSQAANIFETLFGPIKPSNSQRKKMIEQQKLLQKAPTQKKTAPLVQKIQQNKAPVTTLNANQKSQNIVILGDDTASALADGLTRYYNKDRQYQIIKKTNKNFDILNSNIDILKDIDDILTQIKPQLIIFSFGNNSYKALKNGREQAYAFYQAHLKNLANFLAEKQQNWLWVGLAPELDTEKNLSRQTLNQIFAKTAKNYGKDYISIWQSFSDKDGHYLEEKSNPDGVVEKLRSKDGGFTSLGQDKLASLVHEALELATMPETGPSFSQNLNDDAFSPKSTKDLQYIPPTSLYQLDGVSYRLLDQKQFKNNQKIAAKPYENIPYGRVDNFLLAPPKNH